VIPSGEGARRITHENPAPVPRPGESYPELASDGAWCWFADPRAVTVEDVHRRTFAGWVDSSGNIVAGHYDHDTGETAATVVRKAFQVDDHANPAFLVRPDDRLVIFYSAHNGDTMYYRISRDPESSAAWSEEYEIPSNTEGKFGYTYPNPLRLHDAWRLFWRGGNFKPNVAVTTDGVTWSGAVTFIEGSGARPYVKYESDGAGTIHAAFTDGHPRVEARNNIYYVRLRGGVLSRADGSTITDMNGLPLEPSRADLVYDASSGGGRAWIWDIAPDGRRNPVIVYGVYPHETDHRYRYARWSGSRWEDHEITAAGAWFPETGPGEKEREPHYSGGVVLDHADPSVVYLSRQVNGIFEIEKWVTADNGASWASFPVTAGSSKNNIRPVVPRNRAKDGVEVIWMHGGYVHYTDYHTSLRMKVAEPAE